jgi:hypothetical protein
LIDLWKEVNLIRGASMSETPKYLIEFIDSSSSEEAMYDTWNVLLVEGKNALSIASCWDQTVADRILAGFEMLDMLDSGIVPGVPPRQLQVKNKATRATKAK